MEPNKALNENFMYNSMLARALIQLIPPHERETIRLWMIKLHELDATIELMRRRNEYMWFLLLMLQNKRIQPPFTKIPPLGDLKELKDILSADVYEDVLTSTDLSWLDTIPLSNKEDAVVPIIPRSNPADFIYNQPLPTSGVVTYFVAFSDHDY